MAQMNLTLRNDDGSFLIMDMNLTDEDAQPLIEVVKDFMIQHPDKLNQSSMTPEPPPGGELGPPMSSIDTSPYNPISDLIRTEEP